MISVTGTIDMGNSLCKVTAHIIFHVKNGRCQMQENHLARIFQYIGGIIRSLSGCAFIVGGRPDHIHILTTVPASKSMADFVRDIKSNTTKWVKNIDPTYKGFAWQEGYGAFSVSESNKETVIRYIERQKEHHEAHSMQDEYCSFLKKHGVDMNDIHWWCVRNSSIL